MTRANITLGLPTFSAVEYLNCQYTAPFRILQVSDITMFWKSENHLCHDKLKLAISEEKHQNG